jgi:hypothetical protein
LDSLGVNADTGFDRITALVFGDPGFKLEEFSDPVRRNQARALEMVAVNSSPLQAAERAIPEK